MTNMNSSLSNTKKVTSPEQGTPTCVLCGGATDSRWRFRHAWHQATSPEPYEICWCNACGFGFLHPLPSAEEQLRLLKESRERDSSWPSMITARPTTGERIRVRLAWQVSHAHNRQINAELVHDLVGGVSASVCVLGPVDEPIIAPLDALGHRVIVDDPVAVGRPGAPPGGSSFDVVIVSQRLQTSRDLRATVLACREALKPGGYLLADVPNHRSCAFQDLGPPWYFHDAGCSVNFLTGRSLSRLVEGCGFVPSDLLYCNYTVQFRAPRLGIEQEIWDGLYAADDGLAAGDRRPRRNSTMGQWKRLLRSMFKSPDEMYEVVAIIARRPTDGGKGPAADGAS